MNIIDRILNHSETLIAHRDDIHRNGCEIQKQDERIFKLEQEVIRLNQRINAISYLKETTAPEPRKKMVRRGQRMEMILKAVRCYSHSIGSIRTFIKHRNGIDFQPSKITDSLERLHRNGMVRHVAKTGWVITKKGEA